MSRIMKYRDYIGSVEYSEADGLFFGKVLGIHALISYEGRTEKALAEDFQTAVDAYLKHCSAEGKEPEHSPQDSLS